MSLSTAGTGKEGMRVMPCESRASDETQHSRADSDVECGAGGCGGGARPPIQRLKSIYDVRCAAAARLAGCNAGRAGRGLADYAAWG